MKSNSMMSGNTNDIERNSNNGKPAKQSSISYYESLSFGKEGKAEIEYRSLRRYKWANVYLVLCNNCFIIYQSDSKTTIRNRWAISDIEKVEPNKEDDQILVLKIKSPKADDQECIICRFRFQDQRTKDDWFSEFRKVILVNVKNKSRLNYSKENESDRGAISDDESIVNSMEFSQLSDSNALSSPLSPNYNHIHRCSVIDSIQLDEVVSDFQQEQYSITDEEIRSLVSEAEEHILTHTIGSTPSFIFQSGCACGLSFQNKKRQNEDRVFVNTALDYVLRHETNENQSDCISLSKSSSAHSINPSTHSNPSSAHSINPSTHSNPSSTHSINPSTHSNPSSTHSINPSLTNSNPSSTNSNPSSTHSINSRESTWYEYQKGSGKALFAIFDGHNGDFAASWCADNILRCYKACYSPSLPSQEIIQTVIHQLEKELEEAMIQSHQDNMSGCTCALVYLNNNELTIANVGDTQAYLGRTDALVELTQIHDAFNDQERIKRAGGWVTTLKEEVRTRLGSIVSPISPSSPIPFVSTGSPSSPQEIHKEPHPNRIRNFRYFTNGELEVSRSLGDYYLKKRHFNQKQWRYPTKEREAAGLTGFVDDVVSSTPYIKSFRLRGDDNFIVMATDGLWEVINPKACIAIINQLINQYSLEEICYALYWISQQRGSYDNISIVLIDLNYMYKRTKLHY